MKHINKLLLLLLVHLAIGLNAQDDSLYNLEPGIKIHPTAIIHPSVVLNGDIEIGKHTFIGPGTCIWGKVKIGDYCRIYMNVSIRGHNITIEDYVNIFDQTNIESGRNHAPYNEFPVIGKYAWINHGAVMHGTSVGKNAIVGMGASLNYGCEVGDGAIVMEGSACLVDTKIPSNSVVMGVPSKIIQTNINASDRVKYIGLDPFAFIDLHASMNEKMDEMRTVARRYIKTHNHLYREHTRDYVYRIGDDNGNVYSVVELVSVNKNKIIVRINEANNTIVEVHDENYGTWKKLAPLLTARQEFPVIAYENYIYAAGGMDDPNQCCNALNDFDRYDVESNTWEKLADLPLAVSHPGICALNGHIYVFSGYTGGKYPEQEVTKRSFRYNVQNNHWEEIAELPIAAAAPGVVVYNNKIYLFGGDPDEQFDNHGNTTVFAYSPEQNSWQLINNNMPFGRMHIGAALVGSKVYLSPGRPGALSKASDNVVQEFDLEKMNMGKNAWRLMNPLPGTPRTGFISNWPNVNGQLYYIGGENPEAFPDIHVFTPDENGGKWKRICDYPTPIHGIGPAVIKNKIYICGGATGSGIKNKTSNVYEFTVPAY